MRVYLLEESLHPSQAANSLASFVETIVALQPG